MKKPSPTEILTYYASDKFQPAMPDNSGWRHFRFKTATGGWRKVPVKIKTGDDLKKWILKLGGVDLYYSTSTWMNPHKISTKGGSGTYHIADNLLFGNDLVFDIDAKEPITLDSLDIARKSTWNIFQAMKDFSQYKFEYCAFTGFKGFRLVYKSDSCEIPQNPRKRLGTIEKNRKLFIQELSNVLEQKAGEQLNRKFYALRTVFDKKITVNPMCVIRVIGSVHSTTGYISEYISPMLLRSKMDKILDYIPYITKSRPGIPKREMTPDGDKASPPPRLERSAQDVTGLASLPHDNERYFITNRVLGVKKCFIPIFVYQESQTYYKKELEKLQKLYRMGHVYIYRHGVNIIAISLKCMQKRNLQKILNLSSSRTKSDFKRFNRIYAPFSMMVDEILHTKYMSGQISRGHAIYVSPKYPPKGTHAGWPQIELVRAKEAD